MNDQLDSKKKILYLLKTVFHKGDRQVNSEDDHFFGRQINMNPSDLVYIIYLLEQYYQFQFSDLEMDDPAFYTVSGLANLIKSKKIVEKDGCRHSFT